jgi:hypothetical protein
MAKGGRYGKAPTEEQVKAAVSVIQRDYYADVSGVADELKGLIKSKALMSREQVDEWLHETIDGQQRVIYTWQARLGMLVTDNEGAYQDDTGEPPPSVEAAMFMAMKKDVEEEIEREGILDSLED